METKKMISVMQAFSEGKQIEFCRKDGSEWCRCIGPVWNWRDFDYRVKPEPIFRPYLFSELVDELTRGKQFIRLKDNPDRVIYNIDAIYNYENGTTSIKVSDTCYSFEELLDKFTWIEGEPCGVLIKQ